MATATPTAVPTEKKVAGIVLQNISSSNMNLSKCTEGFVGVITNHGFKLGDVEDEKYYILFKSGAARKLYRQNSAWLKRNKKMFKISAESVDFDPEDSVIIPHNHYPYLPRNYCPGRIESEVNRFVRSWSDSANNESNQGFCRSFQDYLRHHYYCSGRSNNNPNYVCFQHIEQVRDMKKIAMNVNHEKCLLLHEMAIDHIRACHNENSKIVLLDLLLNSPFRSENERILRFNQAFRTMREIVSERSLNPKALILHSLTIVRKCFLHLELPELNSLLGCIEAEIPNVVHGDKKFGELVANTVENIRHAANTNSDADHNEGAVSAEQNENDTTEEEVEITEEATEEKVEVKSFLSVCNEENNPGQLILGEIVDVIQPDSMIIQPLGRHKFKVNFETSEVFNNSGERLTLFPTGEPSSFFVTIDFKEKKIFLVEREIIAETPRSRVVTFKDGVEEFSPSGSEEEEPVFLSRPSNHLAVDVDDENDKDGVFDELEKYIIDNPSKDTMKNCKKFKVGSNRMLATLISDIWRKNADWFVSYLKSEILGKVDEGQTEIPEDKIREEAWQNCICKLKEASIFPSDFKKKAVDLTVDFLILKMKDYLHEKEKESLNNSEERIIDVDDNSDDDSDVEDPTPKENAVIAMDKISSQERNENSGLLEKIKELENIIQKKEKEESAFREEYQKKEKEVSELKEALGIKVHENENLKTKITDLRKETDELRKTVLTELEVRTAKLANYERSEKEKDEEIKLLKLQLGGRKPTEKKKQITVVTPLDGKHIYFRPDETNLLPLSQVQAWVPKVHSMFYYSYEATGFKNVPIRLENGFFHPPPGGWGDGKYFASETPQPPPRHRPSPVSPPAQPPAVNYLNIPRPINPLMAAFSVLQQPRPPHT